MVISQTHADVVVLYYCYLTQYTILVLQLVCSYIVLQSTFEYSQYIYFTNSMLLSGDTDRIFLLYKRID